MLLGREISGLVGSRKQEHKTRMPISGTLLSDLQTGHPLGLCLCHSLCLEHLPHFFPWPEQGHVCSSPSAVPNLWQGPGFHVPLLQLHEAHANLLEPWFSQEFQHRLGAASRCAGCQGKQEVSSRPSHKQQAKQALHWKCPGWGQLFPPISPPGPPLLTHPQRLTIVLRR